MVVSISSNTVSGSQVSNVVASQNKSLAKSQVTTENSADGSQKYTSSLSSLSLKLSESAGRAAARDSSLSRREFGEKASELLSKISGDSYFANKKAIDAEVPDTQDPELLARADNATQFVNGNGKNPFAGMSSDQLSLITMMTVGVLRLMSAVRRGASHSIKNLSGGRRLLPMRWRNITEPGN